MLGARPAVTVTRRRALGLFGVLGAGVAGFFGLRGGDVAPKAKVVPGTTRLVESYGPGPRQLGEWWLPPAAPAGRLPTVVLVHGGYWRAQYDRTLEDALSADLASRGFLVWNIEYAASDAPWPATLTDEANREPGPVTTLLAWTLTLRDPLEQRLPERWHLHRGD